MSFSLIRSQGYTFMFHFITLNEHVYPYTFRVPQQKYWSWVNLLRRHSVFWRYQASEGMLIITEDSVLTTLQVLPEKVSTKW